MTSLHNKKIRRSSQTAGGVADSVPALHPDNAEQIKFVSYLPLTRDLSDTASIEEWKERSSIIAEDLQWLLELSHDKFWCEVIFNITVQNCITSFLKSAPRWYDIPTGLYPPDVRLQLENLLHLFFLAVLRMSTPKESKECFIDSKVYAEIIYENFLFDVPRLFDVCAVYGADNSELVMKMIESVFKEQPKYHSDLRNTVPTLLQVFDAICDKCGVPSSAEAPSPRLSEQNVAVPVLFSMSAEQFEDIILYLSDTMHSIASFLNIYPTGASNLSLKFPLRLSRFYEAVVPEFSRALQQRDADNIHHLSYVQLKHLLHKVQRCMLDIFHKIVFSTYLEPLLDSDISDDIASNMVEKYMDLQVALLDNKTFLAHYRYCHIFSIECDLILQAKVSANFDEKRLEYIENAISKVHTVLYQNLKVDSLPKAQPAARESMLTDNNVSKQNVGEDQWGGEAAGYDVDDVGTGMGASQALKSGVELESLISSVQDLLPELGRGFIKICLEEYDYDVEKVVNGLLEDKLKPSLQELDRTMDLPPQIQEENCDSVLSQRRNIYDNDEFDLMSHSIDKSRVHQGKKQRVPQNSSAGTKAFLDDKSTISMLKPLYEKYGNEFVESMYDKNIEYEDCYEDEYDDTYDSNPMGVTDADSADEITEEFKKVSFEKNNFTDRTAEPAENANKSRDLFIEDPAELRRIREERYQARQAQYGRGGRGRGGGGRGGGGQRGGEGQEERAEGPGHAGGKTYEVKGGPKGRGQTDEVLRNRAWKEKHKSASVNHNRKALSDKKRKF